MKRTISILLALVAMTTLATAAFAHTATPRVDRREARQSLRIRDGVRSGELSRREAWRLRAGQIRVHRMERFAKADGFVGPRERARLARMQNRQSRAIYRLKHNDCVR